MKRIWVVGVLIAFLSLAKFGYENFYFEVNIKQGAVISPTPTPIPSPTPTPVPTLIPSPTPTPTPTRPTKEELQIALANMNIPVGKIDGKWGVRTRQGLCIWRELTGRDVNRNLPTLNDQIAVISMEELNIPKDFVNGLNINKTCQSAVWVKNHEPLDFKIMIASTGRPGLETLSGVFKVQWRANRWYESIAYPDGWMYRPMFFNKGEAVHGSEFDSLVYAYPASHGCVRMLGRDIDELWAAGFGNGDLIRVYGTWNPYTTDPIT